MCPQFFRHNWAFFKNKAAYLVALIGLFFEFRQHNRRTWYQIACLFCAPYPTPVDSTKIRQIEQNECHPLLSRTSERIVKKTSVRCGPAVARLPPHHIPHHVFVPYPCTWCILVSFHRPTTSSSSSEAFTAFIPSVGTMYFSVLLIFCGMAGLLALRTAFDALGCSAKLR